VTELALSDTALSAFNDDLTHGLLGTGGEEAEVASSLAELLRVVPHAIRIRIILTGSSSGVAFFAILQANLRLVVEGIQSALRGVDAFLWSLNWALLDASVGRCSPLTPIIDDTLGLVVLHVAVNTAGLNVRSPHAIGPVVALRLVVSSELALLQARVGSSLPDAKLWDVVAGTLSHVELAGSTADSSWVPHAEEVRDASVLVEVFQFATFMASTCRICTPLADEGCSGDTIDIIPETIGHTP